MNAQRARTNEAGIASVLGWTDSEGWQAFALQLIAQYALPEGATVLVDDELHSVHLLDLQRQFPQFKYQAAGATLARLRGIKTTSELTALESAAPAD